MRRRHPRRPHERAVRNAHPGQLGRGRVLGRDVPVRDEVIVEQVRQKPAARREARPAVALRPDVQVLDLQQIPRRRPLHVHRPGERMRDGALELLQVLRRRPGMDLQIVRVPRLERHLLARRCLDHRRDVRVPAVMPLMRLLSQAFLAVDFDAFGHAPIVCKKSWFYGTWSSLIQTFSPPACAPAALSAARARRTKLVTEDAKLRRA